MILEVLQRLDRLPSRLGAYRYVGFGGIFFTDFVLAHRHLGITNMVSIESSPAERFDFNKPLACIDIRSGFSTHMLPRVLNELRRSASPGIMWLDYDGGVHTTVTADVALVAAQAQPLTVLLVTVNCEPSRDIDQRLSILQSAMGDQMPPHVTKGEQLGGWKLAELTHRIISGAIEEALVDRNSALQDADHLQYRQLFHFHYSDGARMLTFGGIFHLPGQESLLNDVFLGLGQIRGNGDPALEIDVPVLTAHEVRHLLMQLPSGGGAATVATSPGLPDAEAKKFASMYQYYPLYAEVGSL